MRPSSTATHSRASSGPATTRARLPVQAPFQAVFDELQLGVAAPQLATANGTWNPVGGVERTEASFTIAGVGADSPRIDALWRGAVVARVDPRPGDDRVGRDDLAGDRHDRRRHRSDLGGLPVDPRATSSDERRLRLVERMRGRARPAGALDDAALRRLARARRERLGPRPDLLDRYAAVPCPPRRRWASRTRRRWRRRRSRSPVTAAVLVRDAGFSARRSCSPTARASCASASPRCRSSVRSTPRFRGATRSSDLGRARRDLRRRRLARRAGAPGRRAAPRRAARGRGAWLAGEGIGLAIPPP